jgi:mono/diheme cytochrome c family protein
VACHTNILRMLQVYTKTSQQWRDTVYSMTSRGAQVMPGKIEPVTAFLAANAGTNRQAITQTSRGVPGSGRTDQQTPEAEGRAVPQQRCQQCHDLGTGSTKLGPKDWTTIVSKMMAYSAKLTPLDQQKLIGYLNGLPK